MCHIRYIKNARCIIYDTPNFVIRLKINLLILLKEPTIEKTLLTLHITIETHFYLGKIKLEISCMVLSKGM